jgi:murein DD-endopeptidase MepM/ murein hydrolase activator NlpD
VRRSVVHCVCLIAAALPLACATAMPPPRHAEAPPPQQPVSIQDAQAMVAMAQIAGRLDAPFADQMIEQMVRWQHDVRDRLHDLDASLNAFVDDVGAVVPDLTVLSIEPVARTESSGFGWRDDPIRHTRSFHSGTDFRGHPGTPVVAAGDGVVKYCGRLGGYGNVIDIDHGGGVVTRYAHLRRIETRKAAAVTAGAEIGQVGSTGRTTGPHLHFEVRIDGAPVSPIAAMAIASLQRELPIAGRLAALTLSPELQATAESDVDPPKQRPARRPERPGRAKRPQVLW